VTVERLDVGGVDLAIRLDENNAPRQCATCGEPATHYVLDADADISRFVCDDHLDATLADAGGGRR
jgi:hypothetical protein